VTTAVNYAAFSELSATAQKFLVARGSLAGASWQVLVAEDGVSEATVLVIGRAEAGGSSGSYTTGDEWDLDRTPSGEWVFGSVSHRVTAMRAVLRGGTVVSGCVVHVSGPVNRGWFALAVPPGAAFASVEGLTAAGKTVLERATSLRFLSRVCRGALLELASTPRLPDSAVRRGSAAKIHAVPAP
jgi:hypothetical protein